jgi:hypothetical protein
MEATLLEYLAPYDQITLVDLEVSPPDTLGVFVSQKNQQDQYIGGQEFEDGILKYDWRC